LEQTKVITGIHGDKSEIPMGEMEENELTMNSPENALKLQCKNWKTLIRNKGVKLRIIYPHFSGGKS
jgi:hypothetical protein